jgi:hypothetical protein
VTKNKTGLFFQRRLLNGGGPIWLNVIMSFEGKKLSWICVVVIFNCVVLHAEHMKKAKFLAMIKCIQSAYPNPIISCGKNSTIYTSTIQLLMKNKTSTF